MSTRTQAWSKAAFTDVSRAKGGATEAKYNTACQRLPSLIHQCGLVQALVFMASRDEESQRLVGQISRATGRDEKWTSLVHSAQTVDTSGYMALTQEVTDIAIWYRRFAKIELGDADDRGSE